MNKNSLMIKKLVGLSVLTALVIILQFIGNNVSFGTVSITLALFPIALGAILYGPVAGMFLGAVMGCVVMFSAQAFFACNPWATVIICLVKSGVAGLLSGFIYKGIAHFANKQTDIKKKRTIIVIAAILATVIVPIANTFIFLVGATFFFYSVFGLESSTGAFTVIMAAIFGTNFAIELVINLVLSPSILTIVKIVTKNSNLGFANDFSSFEEPEEVKLNSNTYSSLN